MALIADYFRCVRGDGRARLEIHSVPLRTTLHIVGKFRPVVARAHIDHTVVVAVSGGIEDERIESALSPAYMRCRSALVDGDFDRHGGYIMRQPCCCALKWRMALFAISVGASSITAYCF